MIASEEKIPLKRAYGNEKGDVQVDCLGRLHATLILEAKARAQLMVVLKTS
jgi:hypothetical protein